MRSDRDSYAIQRHGRLIHGCVWFTTSPDELAAQGQEQGQSPRAKHRVPVVRRRNGVTIRLTASTSNLPASK